MTSQALTTLKERFRCSSVPTFPEKLNKAEQNYDAGNRELLAMKEAFSKWPHWLEGAAQPFLVLINHQNLEYIKSVKWLNPCKAFFSCFNFQITYRPRSKNGKANTLSHLYVAITEVSSPVDPTVPSSLVLGPVQWDIITESAETNATHPPPLSCPADKMHVPLSQCQQVLHFMHDTPAAVHSGIAATSSLISNNFWWSTLQAEVVQFFIQCASFQIAKAPLQSPASPNQLINCGHTSQWTFCQIPR